MSEHSADVVIFGAGIAGLWTFHRLKKAGYDALLLESDRIGCGQTVASQGILHSGLKYAIAGRVSKLARTIGEMPARWRAALRGRGGVDLSSTVVSAASQHMLIPKGVTGGIVGVVGRKALGKSAVLLPRGGWPPEIGRLGFTGSVLFMDELVLDVPSLLRALAEPFRESVRKIDVSGDFAIRSDGRGGEIEGVDIGGERIRARRYLFTAAAWNRHAAEALGHAAGMQVQRRPLLQGMVRGVPCDLFAHCVGWSEKPVATITTHRMSDGTRVWYLGAQVAEREKEADPETVFRDARRAFRKYLPGLDLSGTAWAVWPVDRVEGRSRRAGWMPDLPTLHRAGNAVYCWPTKMTFAPLLGDDIDALLDADGVVPSGREHDWGFLPEVAYAEPPWEQVEWRSADSAARI